MGRELPLGAWELLEREARDLGDDVVDGGLKRGRSGAARDVVAQLIQRIADRKLGRDLGDGEPGRLGRERRGAGDPRVCAGATVMESPVCTPIGSRFSMEHTMMQLSLRSRTTSISNSFQPITDSSTSSSCVGEASKPRSQMVRNSSRL